MLHFYRDPSARRLQILSLPLPSTSLSDPLPLQFTDMWAGKRVSVSVMLVPSTRGSKYVRTRWVVRDQGKGLEEHEIRRLFQSYQQASSSVARLHGGTGLGLTIVRELADLMRGDAEPGTGVGVLSVAGEGSSFWFEVELTEGESTSSSGSRSGTTSSAGSGPRSIGGHSASRGTTATSWRSAPQMSGAASAGAVTQLLERLPGTATAGTLSAAASHPGTFTANSRDAVDPASVAALEGAAAAYESWNAGAESARLGHPFGATGSDAGTTDAAMQSRHLQQLAAAAAAAGGHAPPSGLPRHLRAPQAGAASGSTAYSEQVHVLTSGAGTSRRGSNSSVPVSAAGAALSPASARGSVGATPRVAGSAQLHSPAAAAAAAAAPGSPAISATPSSGQVRASANVSAAQEPSAASAASVSSITAGSVSDGRAVQLLSPSAIGSSAGPLLSPSAISGGAGQLLSPSATSTSSVRHLLGTQPLALPSTEVIRYLAVGSSGTLLYNGTDGYASSGGGSAAATARSGVVPQHEDAAAGTLTARSPAAARSPVSSGAGSVGQVPDGGPQAAAGLLAGGEPWVNRGMWEAGAADAGSDSALELGVHTAALRGAVAGIELGAAAANHGTQWVDANAADRTAYARADSARDLHAAADANLHQSLTDEADRCGLSSRALMARTARLLAATGASDADEREGKPSPSHSPEAPRGISYVAAAAGGAGAATGVNGRVSRSSGNSIGTQTFRDLIAARSYLQDLASGAPADPLRQRSLGGFEVSLGMQQLSAASGGHRGAASLGAAPSVAEELYGGVSDDESTGTSTQQRGMYVVGRGGRNPQINAVLAAAAAAERQRLSQGLVGGTAAEACHSPGSVSFPSTTSPRYTGLGSPGASSVASRAPRSDPVVVLPLPSEAAVSSQLQAAAAAGVALCGMSRLDESSQTADAPTHTAAGLGAQGSADRASAAAAPDEIPAATSGKVVVSADDKTASETAAVAQAQSHGDSASTAEVSEDAEAAAAAAAQASSAAVRTLLTFGSRSSFGKVQRAGSGTTASAKSSGRSRSSQAENKWLASSFKRSHTSRDSAGKAPSSHAQSPSALAASAMSASPTAILVSVDVDKPGSARVKDGAAVQGRSDAGAVSPSAVARGGSAAPESGKRLPAMSPLSLAPSGGKGEGAAQITGSTRRSGRAPATTQAGAAGAGLYLQGNVEGVAIAVANPQGTDSLQPPFPAAGAALRANPLVIPGSARAPAAAGAAGHGQSVRFAAEAASGQAHLLGTATPGAATPGVLTSPMGGHTGPAGRLSSVTSRDHAMGAAGPAAGAAGSCFGRRAGGDAAGAGAAPGRLARAGRALSAGWSGALSFVRRAPCFPRQRLDTVASRNADNIRRWFADDISVFCGARSGPRWVRRLLRCSLRSRHDLLLQQFQAAELAAAAEGGGSAESPAAPAIAAGFTGAAWKSAVQLTAAALNHAARGSSSTASSSSPRASAAAMLSHATFSDVMAAAMAEEDRSLEHLPKRYLAVVPVYQGAPGGTHGGYAPTIVSHPDLAAAQLHHGAGGGSAAGFGAAGASDAHSDIDPEGLVGPAAGTGLAASDLDAAGDASPFPNSEVSPHVSGAASARRRGPGEEHVIMTTTQTSDSNVVLAPGSYVASVGPAPLTGGGNASNTTMSITATADGYTALPRMPMPGGAHAGAMSGSGAIAGANLTLRERDAAATAAALSAPVLTVTAAGSKRKPREIVTVRRASEQAGGPNVPSTTSAHSGATDPSSQAALHHPTLAERAADKAQLLLTQAKKDTDALSAAVAASAHLPGGIAGNATPMHMHFHRMHSNGGGGAAAPFGSPSLAPAPAIALPPMPSAAAVPLQAGPPGAAAPAGLVLAPAVQTGVAPRVVAVGAARVVASMAGSSSEEIGGPTGARAAGPPVAFGPAEMLRQIRKQHSLHSHLYRTLPHPARALLAHLPGVTLPPQAGLLTAEPPALPGGLPHAGSSFAISADGEGIFGSGAGASGSQTVGRDLCLCVTDDEKTQRMMLRTFLTKWGTSVVTADEGRGCLSRVADLRVRGRMFDGICLDINMSPGMGGVETAERLRAVETLTHTCRTMLLAVTANAEPAERATYERAGFDGVVPKPVDRKLLILTVEQLSRRRRILVVEDDAVNGRLLQRLLTKAGHLAVVVTSGEAVVALATEGVAKREALRKRYGDSLAGLTDVLSAAAARAVDEGRRSGTPDSSGGPAMGPRRRSGEQATASATGAGSVSAYGSPAGGTGAGAVPSGMAPMHGVEVATASTSTSHASRHTSATYTHTLTSRSDGASSSARTPHPHGELTAGLASPAAASARMLVATLSRGGLLPAAASPASPAAHPGQSVSPPFAPGSSARAGGEMGSDASPPRAADASMHATRLSSATHSHSSLALHGSPPLSGRNRSGPSGGDGAPLPPIAELPATASLEGADGSDAVGVARNRSSSAAAQPRYRQGIHNVYRGTVAAAGGAADAKPGAVRRGASASAAGVGGGVGSELEVPGVTPLRPAFEGFDLILMDLHLLPGGMDGYQCTQYLRTVLEGAYAGVPIVAMTGSVSAAEKSRCLASGMRGFLSKPIDKDELLDTIAKLTCSW